MIFEFIADRPVLDFLPTLAERGGADVEHLDRPQDLADWITQSRILDQAPPVDAAELVRARAVRDAMFGLVRALVDRSRPTTADRVLVNEAAAQPVPTIRLERGRVRRDGDVAAVLAELARDCLDLHDSADRDLLRWCADDHCTRIFVDRSRGTRRRWCGMRGCGDRAKAAAYRERQRAVRNG